MASTVTSWRSSRRTSAAACLPAGCGLQGLVCDGQDFQPFRRTFAARSCRPSRPTTSGWKRANGGCSGAIGSAAAVRGRRIPDADPSRAGDHAAGGQSACVRSTAAGGVCVAVDHAPRYRRGFRYLERETAKEQSNANATIVPTLAGPSQRVRTLALGVIIDPNISRPLPFAGLSYIDFNLSAPARSSTGSSAAPTASWQCSSHRSAARAGSWRPCVRHREPQRPGFRERTGALRGEHSRNGRPMPRYGCCAR